ncbi:MAG: lipopolysaccharide assembly LapA domain-containing protein [Bacillus sp. (in: firmicutes)]
MKGQGLYIVGIIFTLIVAIFAVLNVDKVEVNYLFGRSEWPLILIIVGSFLIGSVIAGIISSWKITSLKKQVKMLTKEMDKSKKENVKNMEDVN